MTTPATRTERLLQRDRAIVLGGIGLICALAWIWLLTGAGMGMSALSMSSWQFPLPESDSMMRRAWGLSDALAMFAMWWVMMIAMMVPSATPMILLFARVSRRAQDRGQMEVAAIPTSAFATGYLLAWLGFSLAATGLQWTLEASGSLHTMMMWSTSHTLSAVFLLAAGVYQLSPLKSVCLEHCRSPADYLSRNWRHGRSGALQMGIRHGLYCVGCCWVLMGLLFVGGVMNLVWIAALTVLVLAEKILPFGHLTTRITGLVAIAAGVSLLVL